MGRRWIPIPRRRSSDGVSKHKKKSNAHLYLADPPSKAGGKRSKSEYTTPMLVWLKETRSGFA